MAEQEERAPVRARRHKRTAELGAVVDQVVAALRPFEPETQERILRAASIFLGAEVPK